MVCILFLIFIYESLFSKKPEKTSIKAGDNNHMLQNFIRNKHVPISSKYHEHWQISSEGFKPN